MADWYYVADGTEQGPVPWTQIQELWRSGAVDGATRVRRGKDGAWVTIDEATGRAAAEPDAPADPEPQPAPPPAGLDLSHLNHPGLEESRWYYERGRGIAGPVPWAQLRALAGSGEVGADALVQAAGTAGWQSLAELAGVPQAPVGATPAATIAAAQTPTGAAEAPSGFAAAIVDADGWSNLPVAPWRRFFADTFDLSCNGISALMLLLVALASWAPSLAIIVVDILLGPGGGFIFAAACCFLAALLNGWWIAQTGTTPGKWLLGLRVRRADLGRPSFGLALNRQLRQVFLGHALGMVPIDLITWIVGYVKLRRNGITPWDRASRTLVLCRPRGQGELARAIVRYVLATMALFAFNYFTLYI